MEVAQTSSRTMDSCWLPSTANAVLVTEDGAVSRLISSPSGYRKQEILGPAEKPKGRWRLSQGSHRDSVLLAYPDGVDLIDLRTAPCQRKTLIDTTSTDSQWSQLRRYILNLRRTVPVEENFLSICSHPTFAHHVALASSHFLFLVDLRYTQEPLLHWSHHLNLEPPEHLRMYSVDSGRHMIMGWNRKGKDVITVDYDYNTSVVKGVDTKAIFNSDDKGENLRIPPGLLPPIARSCSRRIAPSPMRHFQYEPDNGTGLGEATPMELTGAVLFKGKHVLQIYDRTDGLFVQRLGEMEPEALRSAWASEQDRPLVVCPPLGKEETRSLHSYELYNQEPYHHLCLGPHPSHTAPAAQSSVGFSDGLRFKTTKLLLWQLKHYRTTRRQAEMAEGNRSTIKKDKRKAEDFKSEWGAMKAKGMRMQRETPAADGENRSLAEHDDEIDEFLWCPRTLYEIGQYARNVLKIDRDDSSIGDELQSRSCSRLSTEPWRRIWRRGKELDKPEERLEDSTRGNTPQDEARICASSFTNIFGRDQKLVFQDHPFTSFPAAAPKSESRHAQVTTGMITNLRSLWESPIEDPQTTTTTTPPSPTAD